MAFPSTTVSMSQMNTERGLAANTTVSINNTEVKQMAYQYNQPSSTSVNFAQWRSKNGFSNQYTFTIGWDRQSTASGPGVAATATYYWGYDDVAGGTHDAGHDPVTNMMGRCPINYPNRYQTGIYNYATASRGVVPLLNFKALRRTSPSSTGSVAAPGPGPLGLEYGGDLNVPKTYPSSTANGGWTTMNIANPAYNTNFPRASATFSMFTNFTYLSPGWFSVNWNWAGQPAWAGNGTFYPFGPAPTSPAFPATGSTSNTVTFT